MTLRVDVLTLFPDAIERGTRRRQCSVAPMSAASWELHVHDFRDATDDVHRSVDDTPFGGGAGMVLRAEPILATLDDDPALARPLIALTPSGRVFTHASRRSSRPGGIHAALWSLRGHSTSGRSTSWSTMSSRSVTSCSPEVSWRRSV